MNRSIKALVVGLSAALGASHALAAKETVLTFGYSVQGQCTTASGGFSQGDFNSIGFTSIGWQTFTGTLRFDLSNHKAYETQEGTFYNIPASSGGDYPVIFWRTDSECVYDFHLSSDLSFTLSTTSAGCKSHVLNGPVAGAINTVTDSVETGQFDPDMENFVGGHAGENEPVVQTLVGSPGYLLKRICSHVRIGAKRQSGKQQ